MFTGDPVDSPALDIQARKTVNRVSPGTTDVIVGVNITGQITQEMMHRTEPTTLDLVVALVSGVAAAYTLSRKNVSNSLPGVAIVVALVPPWPPLGSVSQLAPGQWHMAP